MTNSIHQQDTTQEVQAEKNNNTPSGHDLAETLNAADKYEVMLDIDENLYESVFNNHIPYSKAIQSGINHLIGDKKDGELILCEWSEPHKGGREATVWDMKFWYEYNFLQMTKKQEEKKETQPNEATFIVTLGVYASGEKDGQKHYKVVPRIFQKPGKNALIMPNTLYTKDLSTEEFTTYLKNHESHK